MSIALSILLRPFGPNFLRSVFLAALLTVVCLLLEQLLNRLGLATLLAGAVGLAFGLVLGGLIVSLVDSAVPLALGPFLGLFVPLATGFLGLSVGSGRAAAFGEILTRRVLGSSLAPSSTPAATAPRYVDTSALIDGRIADLAHAGFLDGSLVVPQFVLNELQAVADSADSVKRNRGRRGLDVVARLQRAPGVRMEISPIDYADAREVDWKLIEAARERNAQIVTTDFNLSKLAAVQGIRVLNVNELATALRPVVLQGETMHVCIAKEGKEPAQGIAYLEDGTMVVVDNARRQVGKTIDILITGVVQSAAGKMIFGRYEPRRSS